MTVKSAASVRSSSRRLGEAEARIRMAGAAELPQREGGDDDADDADQVHLEAEAEREGQEAQVDTRRRRQADGGALGDEVVGDAGRDQGAQQLAEQGADDEA